MEVLDFSQCIGEIKKNKKNVGISFYWTPKGTPCKHNRKYGKSFFLTRFYSRMDPNQHISVLCEDIIGEITENVADKILKEFPKHEKNVFGNSVKEKLFNGKYELIGKEGSETTYHLV